MVTYSKMNFLAALAKFKGQSRLTVAGHDDALMHRRFKLTSFLSPWAIIDTLEKMISSNPRSLQ